MIYNKKLQDLETLENHKAFYATIKEITNREFVLSSAQPIAHICGLIYKIEIFAKTEERLSHREKDQRIRDANYAIDWLMKTYHDLIDSNAVWR
jgi:hypothetical protein